MRHVRLVRRHDREERRFRAALHNMELQDGHGPVRGLNGRREQALERMKRRRKQRGGL